MHWNAYLYRNKQEYHLLSSEHVYKCNDDDDYYDYYDNEDVDIIFTALMQYLKEVMMMMNDKPTNDVE